MRPFGHKIQYTQQMSLDNGRLIVPTPQTKFLWLRNLRFDLRSDKMKVNYKSWEYNVTNRNLSFSP